MAKPDTWPVSGPSNSLSSHPVFRSRLAGITTGRAAKASGSQTTAFRSTPRQLSRSRGESNVLRLKSCLPASAPDDAPLEKGASEEA